MLRLKLYLILIGSFLGPLNLVIFFFLASRLNHIPFYEKLTSLQIFTIFGGLWYFAFFIPCVISTVFTLLIFWRQLLELKTQRQHVLWGMMFGGVATVFSTVIFILTGAVFNYSHGTSSGGDTLLGLGFAIPGGLILGGLFIIIFSPMLLLAGPGYGLIAMKLKKKFLGER